MDYLRLHGEQPSNRSGASEGEDEDVWDISQKLARRCGSVSRTRLGGLLNRQFVRQDSAYLVVLT